MKFKGYLIILMVIIALILMFQNIQSVSIDLFFWSLELPLIILIAFSLILGFFSGYLINIFKKTIKDE